MAVPFSTLKESQNAFKVTKSVFITRPLDSNKHHDTFIFQLGTIYPPKQSDIYSVQKRWKITVQQGNGGESTSSGDKD